VNILSDNGFRWFLTLTTGIVAGGWAVHDVVFLARLRRTDALFRDKRFGYLMGVVIGIVGVWGCLRYNGVV
jgi:hypothetical protein